MFGYMFFPNTQERFWYIFVLLRVHDNVMGWVDNGIFFFLVGSSDYGKVVKGMTAHDDYYYRHATN